MNDLFVDDDPELREALHAAVTGGPPAPPLDDLLARAHQADRTHGVRRAAAGLAVAAALAVAAVTGAQALGGDSADRTGQVAQDPTPPEQSYAPLDLWVHVTQDGRRLVASPGTEIVRTVADPIPPQPDARYWGVVVRRAGTEAWGLVSWNPKGTFASVEPPRSRYAAFEDWLDHEVGAIQGTPEPYPVAFRPNGSLQPTGGVRIVKEGTGVNVGRPALMTSVAEVVLPGGEHRFVIAYLPRDAAPTYLTVEPDQVPPGGFDGVVDQAPALLPEAKK